MSDETQNTGYVPPATQEEFNARIGERISRLKDAHNAEKTQLETKLTEANTTIADQKAKLETATSSASSLETAANEALAGLLNLIPEDKRKLVPDKYTPVEKIKYVTDNSASLFATVAAPAPPKPASPTDPKPSDATITALTLPGGHKSLQDFAQNDPVGYDKWRKENPRN